MYEQGTLYCRSTLIIYHKITWLFAVQCQQFTLISRWSNRAMSIQHVDYRA